MKQIIRCLSRVSSRSNYSLLGYGSSPRVVPTKTSRRFNSKLVINMGRTEQVPQGHLPIYVGTDEEKKRFVVSAELLNHPIFMELLNQSADEYGYEHQGVLRIPCRVAVFEEVLETLSSDGGSSTH